MCTSTIHRPVVIAGPSGVGKSTLIKKLINEFPLQCQLSVSHTTRAKRENEVDGKNYYFTTKEIMTEGICSGEFIEYTEYAGNLYGTSVKAINEVILSGKICILDVDSEGVKTIKKKQLHPLCIFIQPPGLETLEDRLKKRGTDSEENIQMRLNIAKKEIQFSEEPNSYDLRIVNDQIDLAYTQLKDAIFGGSVDT